VPTPPLSGSAKELYDSLYGDDPAPAVSAPKAPKAPKAPVVAAPAPVVAAPAPVVAAPAPAPVPEPVVAKPFEYENKAPYEDQFGLIKSPGMVPLPEGTTLRKPPVPPAPVELRPDLKSSNMYGLSDSLGLDTSAASYLQKRAGDKQVAISDEDEYLSRDDRARERAAVEAKAKKEAEAAKREAEAARVAAREAEKLDVGEVRALPQPEAKTLPTSKVGMVTQPKEDSPSWADRDRMPNFEKPPTEPWSDKGARYGTFWAQGLPVDMGQTKAHEKLDAAQEARVARTSEWEMAADAERADIQKRLGKDAGDIRINMVPMGNKLGVDVGQLQRDIVWHTLSARAVKEQFGYFDEATWDGPGLSTAMRARGIKDPDALKRQWVEEATNEANGKIKGAFSGKRHLTAITVDNEKLMAELSAYNQSTIMGGQGKMIISPWTPADIMTILAPKEYTLSEPGRQGVNAQLTTTEIRGEDWGDYLPRVLFDLIQAPLAARLLTARNAGWDQMLAQAMPTQHELQADDLNPLKYINTARKHGPKAMAVQLLNTFVGDVKSGNVKQAYNTFMESIAAANGMDNTQQEKENYIRLLRTNPAFRDIVQETFASSFDMTYESAFKAEPPEWMRSTVSATGYLTGMVTGDFVIGAVDPLTIVTGGISELATAGRQAYKLNEAAKLVDNTRAIVSNPAKGIDDLLKSNGAINRSFAEHQYVVAGASTKSDTAFSSGIRALEGDAAAAIDDAIAAKKASEEFAQTIKAARAKVDEAGREVVEKVEWTTADKVARAEQATKAAKDAGKKSYITAKLEQAAESTEQANLLRAEGTVVDSKKALTDYATNNDPLKASIEKIYKEEEKLVKATEDLKTEIKLHMATNQPVIDKVGPLYQDVVYLSESFASGTKNYDELVIEVQKAKDALDAIIAGGGKVTPQSKQAAQDAAKTYADLLAKEVRSRAGLAKRKGEIASAKQALKALTPEEKQIWRDHMALRDRADALVGKTKNNAKLLEDVFGTRAPHTPIPNTAPHTGLEDPVMSAMLVGKHGSMNAADIAKGEQTFTFSDFYKSFKAVVGNTDPATATVLERISKLVNLDEVPLTLYGEGKIPRRLDLQAAGHFRPSAGQYGAIAIRSDDTYATIAHEYVHAAVTNLMYQPRGSLSKEAEAAHDALLDLYNAIVKKTNGTSNAKMYGMTDVHEFVAEALSNKEFQKLLADHRVVKDAKGVVSVINAREAVPKGSSLVGAAWDYIVEQMARLMGMGMDEHTALNHVLKNFDTIAKEPAHLRRMPGATAVDDLPDVKKAFEAEADAEWARVAAEADAHRFTQQHKTDWSNPKSVAEYHASPEYVELTRRNDLGTKATDEYKAVYAEAKKALEGLDPNVPIPRGVGEGAPTMGAIGPSATPRPGIPRTMLEADKVVRKQLLEQYEAAKEAHKIQVAKAGGAKAAAAKAERGHARAKVLLREAQEAEQAAVEKGFTNAAEARRAASVKAGAAYLKTEEKAATLTKRAADEAEKARLTGEQSQAWRQAALNAAEAYYEGMRALPGLLAAEKAVNLSTKVITEDLVRETPDKTGFIVDAEAMLKRISDTIDPGDVRAGELADDSSEILELVGGKADDIVRPSGGASGLKWLSEQETELGQVVKKLTGSTGDVQLTSKEVQALEQGHQGYNLARVLGNSNKVAVLTANTVKGLEAIAHTQSGGTFLQRAGRTVARVARAFDNNQIKLGAINDTLPGLLRAAINKGVQAKDELAYIKTRGKWKHVGAYGKANLKLLGITDEGTEEATHVGLLLDYLGTTNPVIYGPGSTLLNTGTVSGRPIFEQFREQALKDPRVSKFMEDAKKAETDEALDALLKDNADSIAPYLVGVARAWFPTTQGKVSTQTAHSIMVWMMEELKRGADNGQTLPEFLIALRKRTAQLPAVSVPRVSDGVVTSGLRRPTSNAGIGSADKDTVRVMGFMGDLMAHGSNLYEVDSLLTKAIGGVIDVDTMKHVDAFIGGNFKGVDGVPVDTARVMEFFNRMGLPMTSDKVSIGEWGGKIGERSVKIAALRADPKSATWITHDLMKALDDDLGRVVKTLEGSTRTDRTPTASIAAAMVNMWRRSVTVGLLYPRPSFWVSNYLGNMWQTWTILGVGKAAQVGVSDAFTNIPVIGKWMQDAASRGTLAARGKPVLGPMLDVFFNPHLSAVMNGEKGSIKLKNGAILDYSVARREMVEGGVVDTMLREDLTDVFSRHAAKGFWKNTLRWFTGESGYHRAISDFQTMTQQRSRANLWLRLRDEGHTATEASRLINETHFDWKHGVPTIHAFMNLLPFWKFFALGHRQAFRAQMQGFYDGRGAMRKALVGASQMGHVSQQRAVWKALEDSFNPTQQGPFATEEDQQLAAAADADPIWRHSKIRVGLQHTPDSIRQTIMGDTGQDRPYMAYHIAGPTTMAFMDTHFSFVAAIIADLADRSGALEKAYGGSVQAVDGAYAEAVGGLVDQTMPYTSGPLHAVLNKLHLDEQTGDTSENVYASPAEVKIITAVTMQLGLDPLDYVWKDADDGGRAKMTFLASLIAELPYANEIFPAYARKALSPYRLEGDEATVQMISSAMMSMLGFGPDFFDTQNRIDQQINDSQRRLKALEPTGPQHQGFETEPAPPVDEDYQRMIDKE